MGTGSTPRLGVVWFLAVLLSAPVLGQDAGAASGRGTAADRAFEGEEVVTAVDLLVTVRPGVGSALKQWTRGWDLPPGIEAGSFEVQVDGDPVPVIAVEEITGGRAVASDPWNQVVLIDVQGSRTRDLTVALDLLTRHVEDLVQLGVTSIFLRNHNIERVLAPTRDPEELSRVLSQLTLTLKGEDELSDVRYGLRRELLDQSWPRRAADRRTAEALETERGRVLRHQDQLLALAAELSRDAGSRRVLYWVSGGFDSAPEDFYRVKGEESGESELQTPDFAQETRDFGRSLAGYGWLVVPMVPAAPDPLRGKGPGVRVGKMRLHGVVGTYEAERRPKRAQAYLELGQAHLGAGRWEDAAEALDRAYYHFWGDPRTSSKQAAALAHLGEAWERLEAEGKARQALEMAAELDPAVTEAAIRSQVELRAERERWAVRETGEAPGRLSIDDRMGFMVTPLSRPHQPLEAVAGMTSGRVVKDRRRWQEAESDLRMRVRVTAQVPGRADGRLHPLSLAWSGPGEASLASRSWLRSGVPERLTTALARLCLTRDPASLGAAPAPVRVEPLELIEGELHLRVETGSPPRRPAEDVRWLVVAGGAEGVPRLAVQVQKAGDPPPAWNLAVHEPFLVIVRQGIESGAFAARRLATGLD